jgi:hypothetical protein
MKIICYTYCRLFNAESIVMEEGTCDLQLLLRSEDHSPHKHICLLLRCVTGNCGGAGSCGSEVGSSLYSFHHHPSQCCRNSEVCNFFLVF